MNTLGQAVPTQLKNIQTRTGRTLEKLKALIRRSGLTKYGEIRDMLKRELGMSHGDANTLFHFALASDGTLAAAAKELTGDVASEIYSGALRTIPDHVRSGVNKSGPFEIDSWTARHLVFKTLGRLKCQEASLPGFLGVQISETFQPENGD